MKIKQIFKKILPCVLVLSLFLQAFSVSATTVTEISTELSSQTEQTGDCIELDNGSFKLSFNKEAATFTILDKKNNIVWNSIADNTEDDIATGKERTNMASIFTMSYLDENKQLVNYENTFSGAIKTDPHTGSTIANIKTEINDNSLTVYYIFSDIQIVIPIKLTLNSEGFSVSVLSNKIVESSENKVLNITLLPYFGAAQKDDEGYLLLPDGSGAIAYFKDNKSSYATYRAQVYGRDECIDILTDSEKTQTVRLPVFGMKKGNTGFLGIITEGDADAYITASIKGQTSIYSKICAEYTLRTQDSYTMGESSGNTKPETVKVYEKKALNKKSNNALEYEADDFTINYVLLDENNSDYSSMAQIYRDYLMKDGKFKEIATEPTVHLEFPGAIRVEDKLFGISIYSKKTLNDIENVDNILNTLVNEGVQNIDVKYTDWTNQQLKGQVVDKATILSSLGSKKQVKTITEKYSNNINFYFDTDIYEVENIQLKYKFSNIKSFNVSGKAALKYSYELENYLRSPYVAPKNLISPLKLEKISKKYLKSFNKISGAKTSLSMMTSTLSSDFKEEGYTRTDAKDDIVNSLEILSESAPIMAKGGNVYAVKYCDTIIDAPESSSSFDIADESIPFYQMVFSGLVSYTYQPINSNMDSQYLFLNSIESGAGLHYYFVSENDEYLPNTIEYTKFTSLDPNDWIDDLVTRYSELEKICKLTGGTRIVSHKIISETARETTYENGCRIVVNYSTEPFIYNDLTIAAQSYEIIPRGN